MDESDSTFEFIDEAGEVTKALRFHNPDGSLGGWVAVSAIIEPGALVETGGIVAPGAVVLADQVVRKGQVAEREES